MNKYNFTFNEMLGGYDFYYRHYTFFSDMLAYFFMEDVDELLNELKKYEERMLKKYCRKNPQAYEVMIDSLNLLGWVVWEKTGGDEKDPIVKWLFAEYERLMYKDYKNYVSESEMDQIRYNLN